MNKKFVYQVGNNKKVTIYHFHTHTKLVTLLLPDACTLIFNVFQNRQHNKTLGSYL